MKRKGTPHYAMLQSNSTWNSDTCANVSTPLTSRGMQAFFVVNSVKLHLTAFNNCIAKMEVGCLKHPGASTIGSQLLDDCQYDSHGCESWQPSHEPPRHAEGRPSKAKASSERMGLMAEVKPEPHKTTPKSGGTQKLHAVR